MSPEVALATPVQLERFVDRQALRLFDGYLRRSSWALSSLAALRRAAGSEPGADPTLWDVTMGGLESSQAPDRTTRAEYSAFHALTLFAVHQQSRPSCMHLPGQGVGDAGRRWLAATGDSPATRNRIRALASAADPDELVRHLRSMIQQLRGSGVPLDYGLLARQISDFHTDAGRIRVRQRWGRELVRSAASNEDQTQQEVVNEQ